MARFRVSPQARHGHRTIGSALQAAARSSRAALVEIDPGTYHENLTIHGEVELVARAGAGSVIVTYAGEPVIDVFGGARVSGLVVLGRDTDAVRCNGNLTVHNTEIEGRNGASVSATAAAVVTLRDSVIGHGRTVFSGATGLIENCRFRDAADNAVASIKSADIRIRDSWIDGSRIHGILVSDARATISGCELTRTGKAAIAADIRAHAEITGCRIDAVHAEGITFNEQSRGSVDDIQVTDAEHGIAVTAGADPVVRRCTFTGCRDTGINVNTQGLGRFEDCAVARAGNVAVFSASRGAPEVNGCRISDGNVGILVRNARGRFSGIDIDNISSAALRLWENTTAEFAHVHISRCGCGLEAHGAGTTVEVTDASFREYGMAAAVATEQARLNLGNSTAERGTVGFGVGDGAQLLVHACELKDVDNCALLAYGKAALTATNLSVHGPGQIGVVGKDSARIDITDCAFADFASTAIATRDSCTGQVVRCSITGVRGEAVRHNGLIQLHSLNTELPVTERAPETGSDIPDQVVNNFLGPIFHDKVEGSQLAWNNENVHQTVQSADDDVSD